MKIINANAQYMERDVENPYAFIERIGRICYKSESRITPESAKDFVAKLKKNGHLAMLEHYHLYLWDCSGETVAMLGRIAQGSPYESVPAPLRFLNVTTFCNSGLISGSFRTFIELQASEDYRILGSEMWNVLNKEFPDVFAPSTDPRRYVKECLVRLKTYKDVINNVERVESEEPQFVDLPDAAHEQYREDVERCLRKHLTHTILFTCDRGVSHELVRHRPASFAQESTRYCNYGNAKFGHEITVIAPCFWPDHSETPYLQWASACESAEKSYFALLGCEGVTPQQARSVLPNSLKTEIVVTATEDEWQHILNLRYHGTTGAPHPQMKEIMELAYPLLTEKSDNRLS